MKRLLCFIGIHDWIGPYYIPLPLRTEPSIPSMLCDRCHKWRDAMWREDWRMWV